MVNINTLESVSALLKQILALTIHDTHKTNIIGAVLDGLDAAAHVDYTKNPVQAAMAGTITLATEAASDIAAVVSGNSSASVA